ncbi:MAG: multidrug efflux pump subunit AcrA (membrane-fusion protein) [Candidatus Azotimanducaceae bacterium]|jgi:multidrug efflux pump subunit AcrA (membrane-fusion protein)
MNIQSLIPQRFNNRQSATVAAIIVGAMLTSASIFATGPSATPLAIKEKAWPVSVTMAVPQILAPNFSAYGKLESTRIARLRSDLVARIIRVHVKEGSWVEAGQLLIELDARETELVKLERIADVKQALANLSATQSQLELEKLADPHFTARYQLAQDKLKRYEDLMLERLISKALLDEVVSQASQASIEYHSHLRVMSDLPNQIAALQANVAKTQALLARAELDLEKTQIVAPFAGPVTTVFAAPGDHTNLTAPLVEMADVAAAEVRVPIPDAYVGDFRTAQANQQPIFANDGKSTMKLERLAGHVRAGQTATDAFFSMSPEALKDYALGRVMSLSITLPVLNNLVAVPVQSIYDSDKIYRVVDDRLQAIHVERVGEYESEEFGYQVLVRDPRIAQGDQIITTQLPRAIDGLLVDVANAQDESLDPSATL